MNRCRNIAVFALVLGTSVFVAAQAAADPNTGSQDSISSLRQQLQQTQQQLAQSESEIRELRGMMEHMQHQLDTMANAPERKPTAPEQNATTSAQAGSTPSADDYQMLNAEVEEHQQTKVESASKFRLKLSGMFLFNAFSTAGSVDDIDVPEFATVRPAGAPHGSAGASIRQSIIGLTGIGPQIGGAHTSADVQMDFFGGMPSGYTSYSSGIARLRVARMRLDWERTSIVGGLDTPFFSPNSPTTYMSVGEPAFSGSGNLWSWLPTLRVEQRQNVGPTQLKFEAGLFDYAAYGGYRAQAGRYPTPGEASRQPAYSLRVSVNKPSEDHPLAVGFAGIYVPQRFVAGREVNGWGGMSDVRIPITARAEITGEFFTGKGINGFGGTTTGLTPTQDFHYAYVTAPTLASLLSVGGWSQFKFRVNSRNEFNAAAGYGGFSSSRLRNASINDAYLSSVPARNQTMLANYIFRPRSNLIFSLEYRHLRTIGITGPPATADQAGAAAGFLF